MWFLVNQEKILLVTLLDRKDLEADEKEENMKPFAFIRKDELDNGLERGERRERKCHTRWIGRHGICASRARCT